MYLVIQVMYWFWQGTRSDNKCYVGEKKTSFWQINLVALLMKITRISRSLMHLTDIFVNLRGAPDNEFRPSIGSMFSNEHIW